MKSVMVRSLFGRKYGTDCLKGADFMITPISQNENVLDNFSKAIKELRIGKIILCSNISKNCGVSAFEVFQFLLLLVLREKIYFVSLMKFPYQIWKQHFFDSSKNKV